VLGSFVALGRLLARTFDPTLVGDVPLTAGLGMAGMVFGGGLLNLAHFATSGVVLSLVVVLVTLEGLVSFLNRGGPTPDGLSASKATGSRSDRGIAAFAAISLLLMTLTLRYVLSLGHPLHKTDDLPFYLPEIVKLLQTGTLGIESYLFRQMVSLNSQTFLAALGCCVTPVEYAYVVDPGICWIILGGLVFSFLRRDLELPIAFSGLMTTTSLLASIPESNLGGQLSGPVLMVTAVRLMFTGITVSGAPTLGRLVLAGMVLGCLASVKSTMMIYAGLFVVFWSLLALRGKKSTIVSQALPLALLMTLFISPWMIQQYLSSGTLLYPILGKGHVFANHGIPFEFERETVRSLFGFLVQYMTSGSAFPPLVTLLAAAVYFSMSPSALSRALLAASASGVLGSYLIGIMLEGSSAAYRYTSTMNYVTCVLPGLFGITLAVRGDRVGLLLLGAFFMALGQNWPEEKLSSALRLRARIRGVTPPVYSAVDATPEPAYAAKIREVQSLTEPGKRILAGVTSAYFFDFRRNPIWNFDMIGLMSPPPGLPLTSDWTALKAAVERTYAGLPPPGPVADFRDFLTRSGVDYLLFERDPKAIYYLYLDVPSNYNYKKFERMWHIVMKLTHENLLNVARDRHAVFDDGNLILIDLRKGRQPGDPSFVDVGVAVRRVARRDHGGSRQAGRSE
jgi:hypothetical protein